jgi:hypothetical protein
VNASERNGHRRNLDGRWKIGNNQNNQFRNFKMVQSGDKSDQSGVLRSNNFLVGGFHSHLEDAKIAGGSLGIFGGDAVHKKSFRILFCENAGGKSLKQTNAEFASHGINLAARFEKSQNWAKVAFRSQQMIAFGKQHKVPMVENLFEGNAVHQQCRIENEVVEPIKAPFKSLKTE